MLYRVSLFALALAACCAHLSGCHSQRKAASETTLLAETAETHDASKKSLSQTSHAMTMQAWLEGAQTSLYADSILLPDGTKMYGASRQAKADRAAVAAASADTATVASVEQAADSAATAIDSSEKSQSEQTADASSPNATLWLLALALGSLWIATKLKE